MPKQTFEKLPEEKKKKIEDAVKAEFLSHPYSDISINRIIKEAEIPRGSIYQYFEGKEDMLWFVLKDYHGKFVQLFQKTLKEEQGNLFPAIECMLQKIFYPKERNLMEEQCRILFSDGRVAEMILGKSLGGPVDFDGQAACMSLESGISFEKLSLENEEQRVFIRILAGALCSPIVQFLNDGIDRYKECIQMVELLKKHFEI